MVMAKQRPKEDKKREQRITYSIVVDAYNEVERALGWYYYLEETIAFPFAGECIKERKVSPLRKAETVEVVGMSEEDDCIEGDVRPDQMAGARNGHPIGTNQTSEKCGDCFGANTLA